MTTVQEHPRTDLAAARKAMIDSQLRTSGVNAPYVLARMAAVPREDHVPQAARSIAYMDRAIPLADGKALAAPLVHGQILQEAAPTIADKALLVDGGSGYLAALVRPLVGSLDVVTPAEACEASRKGGYTLLLIDGAAEEIPAALVKRLEDGARVVGGAVRNGLTRLVTGRKAAGALALLPLAEIGMPVLTEFARPKRWSF
ncbi:protein-L-isoaspartate O-methyltransferase family protein [Tsuneonella sp. HG222]